MAENKFDPTTRNTGRRTDEFILHLKVVYEMNKNAGIPMGHDALFEKPATYVVDNGAYPTDNKMPSEPELKRRR